jgi:serine protease DegQ
VPGTDQCTHSSPFLDIIFMLSSGIWGQHSPEFKHRFTTGVRAMRQHAKNRMNSAVVYSAARPLAAVWLTLLLAVCAVDTSHAQAPGAVPSLAPMLEKVVPAVVNISTTRSARVPDQARQFTERDLRRFLEEGLTPPDAARRPVRAAGSGVIVDAANGYIVTNHHVVANSDVINVVLADDRQFQARLIGSDASTDVALLQIEADNLQDLPFANVNNLRVGDYVVAIGNPFGIGQTVTSGIVSALGRAGLNAENYEDFIQTDAAINMGNSGGALVDLAGNLVGINTAIISGTGANTGIGFAVPVDMVEAVIGHLQRDGVVRRGQLGIQIRDYTPALEQAIGAGVERGALVMSVLPGSAAEQAGLRVSDVVTTVDGRTVSSGRELRNVVGLARTGVPIELVLYRQGERKILTAILDGGAQDLAEVRGGESADGRRPNDSRYQGASLQSTDAGLTVVSVDQQSPAWVAGLRPGDMIYEVNRTQVQNLQDFNQQVERAGNPVALGVRRENRELLVIM